MLVGQAHDAERAAHASQSAQAMARAWEFVLSALLICWPSAVLPADANATTDFCAEEVRLGQLCA
jgi:hypothetical protein